MNAIDDLNFPRAPRIEEALLLLLYKEGGPHGALRSGDTYGPLADRLDLNPQLRLVTRAEYLGDDCNTPYWHTHVQAAREKLVKSGDLQGPLIKGLWKLTEQGRRRAERVKLRTSVSG
jgi:hypothetical protein